MTNIKKILIFVFSKRFLNINYLLLNKYINNNMLVNYKKYFDNKKK